MGPTVLVVDDQPAFRAVARDLLESDGFVVVGEAADGRSALEQSAALSPDVVLLDVRLPDLSGLDVARALRDVAGSPMVVLTSTVDYTPAVPSCGARAFIAKAALSGSALRAALTPSVLRP
ncbi:MAG: response regulator transcription factor [Actinomycetes bacterium]